MSSVKPVSRDRLTLLAPAMAVLDGLAINLAFYLAYVLRYVVEWPTPVEDVFYFPYRYYFPVGVVLSITLLAIFYTQGLYASRTGDTWLDELQRVVSGTATGIVGLVVFYFFYRPNVYSRLVFFYAAALIVIVLGITHWLKYLLLDYLRRRGVGVERVLIVGAGEVGRAVIRSIVAHPELGYQIVGFVDDDPEEGVSSLGRIEGLGSVSRLPSLVQERAVDEVIITLPWMHHRQILTIVDQCQDRNVRARVVPDLFQMSLSSVDFYDLDGIPLLGVREVTIGQFDRALKRIMDFLAGLAGVLVLAIIYLPVALAIKLDSSGPVLYRQERVGRGGRRFNIVKFRSMYVDADEQQSTLLDRNEADGPLFKIKDDPRTTRVGRVLRKVSLDEWPQFLNVLKGDMSVVGPRPNRPAEVEAYKPWHRRRLEVKPGITGLWQVGGRSEVPFDEMVLLDVYYIENWSVALDLKVMLRTVPLMLFSRGAY
ncbi:MAG: undecaprenyl-phosphate glucose phosphotransferase [Anaerolineae bacterium]|nr:undecaprenyl-phosphate glucose phosphotransferase [Anaerolineae bacterium]